MSSFRFVACEAQAFVSAIPGISRPHSKVPQKNSGNKIVGICVYRA